MLSNYHSNNNSRVNLVIPEGQFSLQTWVTAKRQKHNRTIDIVRVYKNRIAEGTRHEVHSSAMITSAKAINKEIKKN